MTKEQAKAKIVNLKLSIDDLGTKALFVAEQLKDLGDDQLNHTIKIIVGITAALYGSVKKHELQLIDSRFKRSVKHGKKDTKQTNKAR